MAKKNEELQKTTDSAALMERPDFIEKSSAGNEGITKDDLRLPRLKIAQGLSPQLTPGDSSFIDGLRMFDLFNDLSGQVYGKGPIKFIVGRRDVLAIEFDPENRGVPLDLDVPLNDGRLKWGKDPDTKQGIPPRATKFVEFALLLLDEDNTPLEPIMLSVQETNKFAKKAHQRLTGFINLNIPPAPIYAKIYSVETGSEKNDKGTFGVYVVKQLGFIKDPALYTTAKQFHQSLEGKTIHVEREPGDEDVAFDPETMEGDSSGM